MHPNDHSRTIYNSRDMNTTKGSLRDEEIKKRYGMYIKWNTTQP